jgi:hypothetical protein
MRRAGGDSLFSPFPSMGYRYASFESLHIRDLRRFCTDLYTELCRTVQNTAELCLNKAVNGAVANQLIPAIPPGAAPAAPPSSLYSLG